MAQPLSFEIKLTDTFSPKLRTINGEMANSDKLFKNMKGSLGGLDEKFRESGGNIGHWAEQQGHHLQRFFTFDLAKGAEMAVEMLKKVAEAFVDIGKEIVNASAKTQDINFAMNATLGAEGADRLREVTEKLADKTRLDDDVMKRSLLSLSDIGIKDTEMLGNIATVAADLSARTAGQVSIDDVVDGFRKIALKGDVNQKMLNSLGVSAQDYFKNVAELTGNSVEKVKKLAQAGKLDKITLMSAALDEIQKRTGGSIGGTAMESTKTLGGSLDQLAKAWEDMFKKIADGPGMKVIGRSLDKLTNFLKGEGGDKFMGMIDRALTKIGELLTPENIDAFFTKLSQGLDVVVAVAGGIYDIAMAAGNAMQSFREFGESVATGTVDLLAWITALPGRIWQGMSDIGTAIWQGLTSGITSGFEAIKGAVSGLAGGVTDSFRSLLGIHSPSRVMAELGRNTAEGFAVGLSDGISTVDDARRRLMGDTTVSAGSVSGGQNVSISFGDMHFGAGVDRDQAEGFAQQFRVEIEKTLTEISAGM